LISANAGTAFARVPPTSPLWRGAHPIERQLRPEASADGGDGAGARRSSGRTGVERGCQGIFATLNSKNRYAVLFRTQTAKKPETRAKRIARFVTMLERHETLYP
jgi:hypothetical protein